MVLIDYTDLLIFTIQQCQLSDIFSCQRKRKDQDCLGLYPQALQTPYNDLCEVVCAL